MTVNRLKIMSLFHAITISSLCYLTVHAFVLPPALVPMNQIETSVQRVYSHLKSKFEDGDDDKEEDWRDFRAKLVMQYQRNDDESDLSKHSDNEQLDMESWAYAVDGLIEKGTVIISRPEQDFNYGLRQQYFHKSVILILYHSDDIFTKGIILNRPCNLVLAGDDFENEDGTPLEEEELDLKFRVWFGGEVQDIHSENPEIICLHSLEGDLADEVSENIIKGIKYTTIAGARKLVVKGEADLSDFWVSCGYVGWEPGQLQDEVDRNAWYMIATDSQTVLTELQSNNVCKDPQEAGLDAWNHMMYMIGKKREIELLSNNLVSFDDLMLREWAREKLVFENTDEDDYTSQDKKNMPSDSFTLSSTIFEGLDSIGVGSLVRSRCQGESPFLLNNQEYHKSIMLILQDDENSSIGVMLNLPTTNEVYTVPFHQDNQDESYFDFVERYGGSYEVEEDDENNGLLWFHCNENLRAYQVGMPLGKQSNDIWTCSRREAVEAIERNLADPKDFIVVNGCSIFNKENHGENVIGGIKGAILDGYFEVVDPSHVHGILENLTRQKSMSLSSLEKNLMCSFSAWTVASQAVGPESAIDRNDDSTETRIFQSDITVLKLADNALRSWIATFLLGKP